MMTLRIMKQKIQMNSMNKKITMKKNQNRNLQKKHHLEIEAKKERIDHSVDYIIINYNLFNNKIIISNFKQKVSQRTILMLLIK